jgi:hypothetical protein
MPMLEWMNWKTLLNELVLMLFDDKWWVECDSRSPMSISSEKHEEREASRKPYAWPKGSNETRNDSIAIADFWIDNDMGCVDDF